MAHPRLLQEAPPAGAAHEHSCSLAKRIWDLDWSMELPWQFDDVTIEPGTFEDALPFIRDHYAKLFGTEETVKRFLADPLTEAKRRFGKEMDVFVFRADGSTVGLLIGHPSDWTTYYMRSVAILPEYRARNLLARAVEATYAPLAAAGVQRIEGECSPANTAMMHILTGMGFMVMATVQSERWGSTVRFVKYLSEDAEGVFRRQFCAMGASSRTSHGQRSGVWERRRP